MGGPAEKGRSQPAEENVAASFGSSATVRHEPSAALAELTAEVQRFPEVRSERVAEVKARLASGHYLTRESAELTARALTTE